MRKWAAVPTVRAIPGSWRFGPPSRSGNRLVALRATSGMDPRPRPAPAPAADSVRPPTDSLRFKEILLRPPRQMRLAVLAAGSMALCATPAAAVAGTTYAHTAQIVVGDHDRGCSGVLVEPEWPLTAASCFADNPAASLSVSAGKPRPKTTATAAKAGAITTFSLIGSPARTTAGSRSAAPASRAGRAADQQLGASLHFTGTRLYVGMPYGPSAYGALDALPLPNVTAGATNAAVTTYQPGQGGLPAAGARFGYAAR